MSALKPPSSAAVHLKPVEVPPALQEGDKFIKWDEDSGVGTPVTLRVDDHGFYLYWVDQNKEMDLLDISTIRDSRTGKQAKIPKDPKLRQIVTMGSQDTLEEKTVTLCCGPDFVNLTFINFCCTKKEIAQLWTEEILKLAFSLTQLNSSVMTFLSKAHTKLRLTVDKAGRIPIKNIVKVFALNKEDRKRVKNALDTTGFPSGKDETLSAQKFTFEEFFNFYKNLTQRTEVEKIFEEMCGGGSKRKSVSVAGLVEFLNKTQRDPRLNEILHPYADEARARDLIAQYEPKAKAGEGLSLDGFLAYLLSADNPIVAPARLDLSDDMDHPLTHYFINSSHNTYLTGHQLTGKSSVEMYRQCLLAGCRCVELDFWNGGRAEEPVIVHGYTFVPEISAKEVIEAIAESAFKTSDFPVVLSFENHCNPRQQAKIAQYCRDSFGDMLLDQPLDSHQLEAGVPLPPPSMLKRKIIIKNKKKQAVVSVGMAGAGVKVGEENGEVVAQAVPAQSQQPTVVRQPSRESKSEEEDNEDEELESWSGGEDEEKPVTAEDKGEKAKETEAGAEISALVNYVQPVHFTSFESSEKKNRTYEMSSFDEKQATMLLKERPIEFVKYNKRQLSRVYPAGTRFDSSNFMPQVFWNAGCQLVALNYQTLDLAMQLNLGIFEYNHRCGYLLKPEFMRRPDRRFDPFAESTVDGIIAGSVSIHVLSGQFLTDKRCGTYVEVDMYGLPADTVRKKFRTRIIANNAINPLYDEEPFVFKKVVLPELACIRIAAYEEGGRFIGHRVLPVVGLCPGYRHVSLRTESGQPLPLATLFLHIVVKDYVPDGLSDFAEALANPIKYQSELEKRAQQLAVLTDDLEIDEGQGLGEDTSVGSSGGSRKRLGSGVCTVESGPPGPRGSIAGVVVSSAGGLVGGLPPTLEESTPDPPPATPLLIESSAPSPPQPQPLVSSSTPSTPGQSALVASPPATLSSRNTMTIFDCVGVTLPFGLFKIAEVSDDIIAPDSLEKLMDSKPVREKKAELDKKLETLRKKHEKERSRIQSSQDPDKPRTKFYISNKLVKRLSSKNMEVTSSEEGEVVEGGEGIPRSQSERLLTVCRDHLSQERDLHEKYHELVYASAHKVMVASQSQQLKTLHSLLERETSDVMRRLQAARRQEVKALAKNHRDRDELVRMKREVASSMVEKGVHERVRLTELYEKKREELERQHCEIRTQLADEKAKAKSALEREYEGRCSRVEEEVEGKH